MAFVVFPMQLLLLNDFFSIRFLVSLINDLSTKAKHRKYLELMSLVRYAFAGYHSRLVLYYCEINLDWIMAVNF